MAPPFSAGPGFDPYLAGVQSLGRPSGKCLCLRLGPFGGFSILDSVPNNGWVLVGLVFAYQAILLDWAIYLYFFIAVGEFPKAATGILTCTPFFSMLVYFIWLIPLV